MTKLFTPSTTDLNNMINVAMNKCDRAIAHTKEQDVLKREAHDIQTRSYELASLIDGVQYL